MGSLDGRHRRRHSERRRAIAHGSTANRARRSEQAVRASQRRALQRGRRRRCSSGIRVGATSAGRDHRHGEKREQDIQNVPIAITAFTTETLRAKGVTDINSLTNLTPNVNLDSSSPFSGDTSVLSASIRGIGQDDFAFNLDPGVGVYLDGVFLARTFGANQNLMDVDRVEILKGPQGTLFGRNTIGGAIQHRDARTGRGAALRGAGNGGRIQSHRPRVYRGPADHRLAAVEPHGVVDQSRWATRTSSRTRPTRPGAARRSSSIR